MSLKAYPFIRPLLFFILGILAAEYDLIGFHFSSSAAAVASIALAYGLYAKNGIFRSLGIFSLIFFLGFLVLSIHKTKPIDLGKTEAYVARVNSAAEIKPKSYKVKAEIFSKKNGNTWQSVSNELLLYINKENRKIPEYGDVFLINTAPREIEAPKNPYEFNYKTFQARKGILYHHFLKEGDYMLLGSRPKSKFMQTMYALNARSAAIFKQSLSEKYDLAVAQAMILGTKDELDNEVRDAYATAGAVHILAVSGLHVGILMIMLNALLGFLKKLPKGLWIYGFTTIACLWLYALFTGLSPSVTRATLMFSLFQLGTLIQRDKNSINVLAASAFILLLFKPFWLFEVGFQLSYLAIFGIVFLYPYLNRLWQPKSWLLTNLWQISIVSISAQLFTFPLSLYYFHQFPSYFLITNPLVTLSSMGVLFFGIPFLIFSKIPFLGLIFQKLLLYTLKVLNFSVFSISALPMAKMSGFSLEVFQVITWYILLMLLIFFFLRKVPKLLFAAVACSIFLFAFNLKRDLAQKNQSEICFHYIPRGSGISIIQSKTAQFISDSVTYLNPRAYDFHLKNYYDALGIQQSIQKTYPDTNPMTSFEFLGKKYLLIQQYSGKPIEEKFDRILVSNNAVYTLKKQFKIFPSLVILDDSNSKYRVMKLKSEADSLGINLVSLYETGGLVFKD